MEGDTCPSTATYFAVLMYSLGSNSLEPYNEMDGGSHGLASPSDIRTLTTALLILVAPPRGRQILLAF